MLMQRIAPSRIPLLRRTRPPDYAHHRAGTRSFARHTPLLLLTRHTLRPQLPYLSQPSVYRRLSPIDRSLLRLLSTESRRSVRDFAWLTAKWSTVTWTVLFLLNVILFGLSIEITEHSNPTPPEWSFWTRQAMRKGRVEIEALAGQGYINWNAVALAYLEVIRRLDDEKSNAKATATGEPPEDFPIPDLGIVSRDVSDKSWAWRQGYFEALMGAAQASENMEDMVRDTTRKLIFPKATMIGPSNPDPRPVSKDMAEAPLEEHCERPMQPPEQFYTRILSSTGFTARQRLSAALAYASWLEHTGLNDASSEVLKWAVDIASGPVVQQGLLIRDTFVLDTSKTGFSENLLHAVTAYGVHQARIGDAVAALPILLSVFKARQEAPVQSTLVEVPMPKAAPQTDLDAFVEKIRLLFTPKSFPEPPTSGDEAYARLATDTCEDGELMLYIGELMYALTSRKQDGLAWTKRAVNVAEQEMRSPSVSVSTVDEMNLEVKKCRSCLKAGIENWKIMLEDMTESSTTTAAPSFWSLSKWTGTPTTPNEADSKIQEELARIEQLRLDIVQNETEMDILSINQSNKYVMYAG